MPRETIRSTRASRWSRATCILKMFDLFLIIVGLIVTALILVVWLISITVHSATLKTVRVDWSWFRASYVQGRSADASRIHHEMGRRGRPVARTSHQSIKFDIIKV